MSAINPYQAPAGPELDHLIHVYVMRQDDPTPPAYSTDEKAARRVLSKLKSIAGRNVVVGQTSMRTKRFFARYESDPSDGTEVLAESLPLAICRLALLHVVKDQDLDIAGAT